MGSRRVRGHPTKCISTEHQENNALSYLSVNSRAEHRGQNQSKRKEAPHDCGYMVKKRMDARNGRGEERPGSLRQRNGKICVAGLWLWIQSLLACKARMAPNPRRVQGVYFMSCLTKEPFFREHNSLRSSNSTPALHFLLGSLTHHGPIRRL